jgi:hypothetical protein
MMLIATWTPHVAAGLEVVALADAAAPDRLADGEAVLGVDEGDIVDDEDARLADAGELRHRALRAHHAIAAAIEGPGAAEGAVPGAAAGELDRGAGVENADEVLAAMAQQVARRREVVEAVDKARRRSLAPGRDRAGDGRGGAAPARDRGQELGDRRLALAFEDAIDRPRAMLEDRRGGKGGAVPAHHDEAFWQQRLGALREVDDLRNIGEVVAREADDIGAPRLQPGKVIGMALDLQIDQLDRMAGPAGRLGHQLEPQGLEPQKDPGIHQPAGMRRQELHRSQPHQEPCASPPRTLRLTPFPRAWFPDASACASRGCLRRAAALVHDAPGSLPDPAPTPMGKLRRPLP